MENARLYSAMQSGEPLKRYVKTILGQVHLLVLDPFNTNNRPQELILSGSPGEESSYVEVWSEVEDRFIQKANRSHIKAGRLKAMETPIIETPSPNEITDTEIEELLNSPFMSLKNKLDKFTSSAPVYRILEKAKELEKSNKIIENLEKKLAELSLE